MFYLVRKIIKSTWNEDGNLVMMVLSSQQMIQILMHDLRLNDCSIWSNQVHVSVDDESKEGDGAVFIEEHIGMVTVFPLPSLTDCWLIKTTLIRNLK